MNLKREDGLISRVERLRYQVSFTATLLSHFSDQGFTDKLLKRNSRAAGSLLGL